MTVGKRFYTTDQLHMTYGIPIHGINKAIIQRHKRLQGLVKGDRLQGHLRALESTLFAGSLRALNIVNEQARRLLESQGDGYKAFVTSEANRALELVLKANKQLMELADHLRPKQGTGTHIQILNQNTQNTDQFLTTDKAILLLDNKGQNRLPDATDLEGLYLKHGIGNTEEIDARILGNRDGLDGPNLREIVKVQGANRDENEGPNLESSILDAEILDPEEEPSPTPTKKKLGKKAEKFGKSKGLHHLRRRVREEGLDEGFVI